MAGLHGGGQALPIPQWSPRLLGSGGIWLQAQGLIQAADMRTIGQVGREVGWLVLLYGIVWGLPNTQQIFVRFEPALEGVEPGLPAWLRWRPSLGWALTFGGLATLGLLSLGGTGEFLYFKF
jgi:hypothetical protein